MLDDLNNLSINFQWIKEQSWESTTTWQLQHTLKIFTSQASIQKVKAHVTHTSRTQSYTCKIFLGDLRFSVHQLNCHFFLTHPFSYFCIISFQKGEGSSNKKKITCTNHVDRLLITSNLTQISQKFFFQVHDEFNTFVNRILTVAYRKNLNIWTTCTFGAQTGKTAECRMR